MTAPQPFVFASQRLRLSACQWGDDDRPLIVLVHGALDQKRSWDWTADMLARRFRVIAYDLRGHGESDHVNDGDYGVMDHVFDLAALADHLGAAQFHLVGHSLGGNIALRYAGLFPDRVDRLAAIEGLGPSPKLLAERAATPVDARLRAWIDDRRERSARAPRIMADYDEALARMTKAHGRLSPTQLAHLTRTGLRKRADGRVEWAYDHAMLGRSPSDIPHDAFKALIGAITARVWLVYGAKSWASNPERDGRIEYFSRRPALSEYENAGHWLHHDRFDDFIRDLTDFLEA